jgi:putative FmdB family regulatory protein
MPYYSFRCTACDEEFETLVRASDTEAPACPKCGSSALERQMGTTAPAARTPGMLTKARSLIAREGHFSNYSRKELKGK